jgi:hypothetical protein
MSVIADELHITIVIVVVRHYLLHRISTCSAGAAGGIPVRMYVIVVPWTAITKGLREGLRTRPEATRTVGRASRDAYNSDPR